MEILLVQITEVLLALHLLLDMLLIEVTTRSIVYNKINPAS